MNIESRDERFLDIVPLDLKLETLADGFDFTEGPIWHPHEKHLTFSDIPANRMHRWTEKRGVKVFRKSSNMTNGNTYDHEGRILSCEHATSRVTRTESNGDITVLASHYQGKELNSPNDIVVRRDGSIFFTDPTFGRLGGDGHRSEAGTRSPRRLPDRFRRRAASACHRFRPAERPRVHVEP